MERVSAIRPQTATSSQPRLLCESLSQCVDGTLEHTNGRTTRPFVSFFIAKSTTTDPVPYTDFAIAIRPSRRLETSVAWVCDMQIDPVAPERHYQVSLHLILVLVNL